MPPPQPSTLTTSIAEDHDSRALSDASGAKTVRCEMSASVVGAE